jgi:hypothetical protein
MLLEEKKNIEREKSDDDNERTWYTRTRYSINIVAASHGCEIIL